MDLRRVAQVLALNSVDEQFRVIHPRFLPFVYGGGGHGTHYLKRYLHRLTDDALPVTGGGSICM